LSWLGSHRLWPGLSAGIVKAINISYLTPHGGSVYSDASDDGRGDLRQLAPRKKCAKPLASFRSPATVWRRAFHFALSKTNNVAI
jgi:hypothetical protein